MATLLDDRWSIAKETTYGTAVTTTRHYPYLDGTEFMWDNRRRQGEGLHGGTGRHSVYKSRSFVPQGQGMVKTKVELESKGAGLILDLSLGVSTVTAITGGSQQVFHPGISGTYMPSATIQHVWVDNTGTERVHTYLGCTPSKVTIEQPADNIMTLETEWDAWNRVENIAAAAVTYASNPVLFDAYQATASWGGAFTAPTTTALATGLTTFADFESWKLEIDHGIDDKRWLIGGRQRPTAGTTKIGLDVKANVNATTLIDAITSGAPTAWQQTATTTEALSTGFTQLQVAVPALALNGDYPKIKPGETVSVDLKGDVLNDGTNRDVYVVYRSTDTAL